MTEYVWTEVRDSAVRAFDNELPHAQTEEDILEIFERHPTIVTTLIPQVAGDLAAGKIRSGWAILRKRLLASEAARQVTVTDLTDREDAERKARSWIHNVAVHYDRETEVTDALFGDTGLTRNHRTPELEAELLTLWKKRRPAGTTVETAELERAAKWKAWHATEQARLHRIQPGSTEALPEKQADPEPSLTLKETAL